MVSYNIELNCSLHVFTNNNIPIEHAKILLSDLMECASSSLKMKLKTNDVVNTKTSTNGIETGIINIRQVKSIYEKETIVENAAICLSFLFFVNGLSTTGWFCTPRRGEHWDYFCFDKCGKKIVIEVGGSSEKYGAQKVLRIKYNRFNNGSIGKEPTFISAVGFNGRNHLVNRYQ